MGDRRLSKEHKDLETLHELKGPMTRSNSKLLQEEMAKRIKDGLLVKGSIRHAMAVPKSKKMQRQAETNKKQA